jgi:hypothetical protein
VAAIAPDMKAEAGSRPIANGLHRNEQHEGGYGNGDHGRSRHRPDDVVMRKAIHTCRLRFACDQRRMTR